MNDTTYRPSGVLTRSERSRDSVHVCNRDNTGTQIHMTFSIVAPPPPSPCARFETVGADGRAFPSIADRQRFERLKERWLAETGDMAVLTRKIAHESYYEIIGMGERAIPLLLDELRRETGYWFFALRSIVGDDIAPRNSTYREAVAVWLAWGQSHGYI
jgi:hypothetical protein